MSEEVAATHEETSRRGELKRLWPALTFHYGITPAELQHLPNWCIRMYADALPALLARRQLREIEVSAYPHCSEDDQRQIMSALQAHVPASAGPPAPETLEEAKGLMAMTGVGFKIVDADGNEVTDA